MQTLCLELPCLLLGTSKTDLTLGFPLPATYPRTSNATFVH